MTDTTQLRRWIHHLFIGIAFAIACGRIASVQRIYEPAFHRDPAKPGDRRPVWPSSRPDAMPMFGSNDRARWATIRALVHDHTYVTGKREIEPIALSAATLFAAADSVQAAILLQAGYDLRTDVSNPKVHNGIIFKPGLKEHGWATIDRVLDPRTHDKKVLEFHSSKPPFLSTLLAPLYWVIFNVFGLSLIEQPTIVVRLMLILVNALPYAGYLWLLSQVAERWGKTDWGKIYIVAAGAFATTVTPFLITLQNHTFGTFATMAAWWSLLCVWDQVTKRESSDWRHFISAGFFSSFAAACEMPALSFLAAAFVLLLMWSPGKTLLLFLPTAMIPAAFFFATNYIEIGQLRPVQSEFDSEFGKVWYQYEGSHWRPNPEPYAKLKTGIDWAKLQESRAEYAMHVLVGHHGLFSLTPIWILAGIAMIVGICRLPFVWRQVMFTEAGDFPWFVQPLGLALTVVVTGFYITNDASRNYGGFSNGLRWLMWLTPIWLTCLIPMIDRLAALSWGRWLAGLLLLASIFSASYQLWSPWRQPWIYDLMIELGWKGY
jgi:hypothetical protein